jgi:hypothetical protein
LIAWRVQHRIALDSCLVLAAFALACGKRGDPLPPYPHTPTPLVAFSLSQRGDHIEVAYVAPRSTVSGDRLGVLEVKLHRADTEDFNFAKVAKRRSKKVAPGEAIVETEDLPAPGTLLRYQAQVVFRGAAAPPTPVLLLRVQPEVCTPTELRGRLEVTGLEGHLELRGVTLEWTPPDPMPMSVPPPVAPAPPRLVLPAFMLSPSPSGSPSGAASPSPASGSPSPLPSGEAGPTPPESDAREASPLPPGEGLPSPAPSASESPAPLAPGAPPAPASPPPSAVPALPSADAPPSPSRPPEDASSSPSPSPAPSGVPASPRPPEPAGFLVYRRAPDGVFVRLGAAVHGASFLDGSAKPGDNWCYVVRTEISTEPVIESKSSNEVCVEIRDIVPPAPPVALTALPKGETIELRWSPSLEADLLSYRLYRTSVGPPTRIAEIPKTETTFEDHSVERGVAYRYTLTAIDQSGNESAPSLPAEGRIP